MRNRLSKCSKHVAFAACMLALGGSFSACQDEYTLDDAKPVWLNSSIYETLESDGSYTNYLRLIGDPDVNTGENNDESSLVQILSKTGSKTVFAANDQAWQNFFEANKKLPKANPWHYAQSYEQLSKNQKKLLLHTSMLNNAITMESLSSNSGETPTPGMYLRRYTDVEVVDTITKIAVTDLPKSYWTADKQATEDGLAQPEVDQWSRIRNGGLLGYDSIYMVMDSSLTMMIHFTNEYMAKKQITDEDFRIIMGRERITSDVHIYDALLDSADIVCENGYINMTEKPLVPLANMAEAIRTNGKTYIYSHILDRFSVPFQNKTVARLYSKLDPNFLETDTLYSKRYYSKRSYGSTGTIDVALTNDERGNLFANGEAILKFDPGWNEYYPNGESPETDMGAMFVPNDAQMVEYFNTGGGKTLLEEYCKDHHIGQYSANTEQDLELLYNDIDQIPLSIFYSILNHGMFDSFVATVPSKMLKQRETTTQEQIFTEPDTRLAKEGGNIDTVLVTCNGALYIMNNVFTPSDFNCVATPAFIRSTNKILRWAIYSDATLTSPIMNVNYYAYLKAMQSRFSFFLPNDEAMQYYYDPMSFTSRYPRVMRFLYTSGNFPFATKSSKGISVLANFDVNTGTIGRDLSTQTTNQQEVVNRLRQLLEHNTIVHEDGVNAINTEEDEYYLSKNGMGIKVIRDETGVIKAQGGFQIENEHEGLAHNHPGILYCNVLEKGDYKNGCTFTVDAPLIPASRSVFSVMSNIKRGQKGEPQDYNSPETIESNPYYEFFRLCNEANENLIVKSGVVNENDPKYDVSTSQGATALNKAVNKYMTFVDNNAVDYNIQFWDNYNYTVFAPTNEAIREAVANGLPTWESIEADFEACANEEGELTNATDSLRIQEKIIYLTNFIRTHFADNTVFADKSDMNAEMFTSSFNNETGLFVKSFVQREGGMLKVKDNTTTGQWITTKYTTDDGRDVKNIMTCDRECNSKVKDQSMNNKTTDASNYAVIHLINGVLNHEDLVNGQYPDFQKDAEENGGKAARAYIQKFAIR